MKKNKKRNNFRLLPIVLLGILALSVLLLADVVQRNGLTQRSQAAGVNNKNQIPFICAGCNLTGDNGFGTRLKGKDLTDAYFNQAQITNVDMSNTTLTNAVIFGNLNFSGNNFANDDFTNSVIGQQRIQSNSFVNANFTNANLSGSAMTGNDFTGAIWSNTTCADGTNSNNDGGTCIGHLNGQ